MRLTTPGNSQRKPPGWALRVYKTPWAQHKEVFSRILGRQLTLPRRPGSPSISWPEWRAGLGEKIYFLALEPAILPAPHLLPGQRTTGHPQRGLLGPTGAQSRVDGHWPPQAPSPKAIRHLMSLDCPIYFQNCSLKVTSLRLFERTPGSGPLPSTSGSEKHLFVCL